VKPKIAVRDLFRLLDIAGQELNVLRFFERGYNEREVADKTVIHLLIKTLLRQLQALDELGIFKGYIRDTGSGPFKPRVNFARTLQRHWSRGNFSQASFESFRLSKDHPLNRLLKYTIWYCGNYLSLREGAADLKEQVNFFLDMLETVPLDRSLAYLPAVRRILDSGQIPGLRHYYEGLARTCLFIIGNSSISLEIRGEDISLLSFILNLEELFEKYIRNVLKRGVPGAQGGIRVLDGNKEGGAYLFSDSRMYEIHPDIIITTSGKPSLIADVKYKQKITEADRYQIIAHASSMKAQTAIIVVPSFLGGPTGLIRRGRIGDRSVGIEVFEFNFRLDDDLPSEEKRFSEQIFALAQVARIPSVIQPA